MAKHRTPSKTSTAGEGRRVSVRKAIGGWVEMEFDREIFHQDVRWLRVKLGMGGRGDREDWIADIDGATISVSDYQWKPPFFSFPVYKSRGEAMSGTLRRGLQQFEIGARKALAKANKAISAIQTARKRILANRRHGR